MNVTKATFFKQNRCCNQTIILIVAGGYQRRRHHLEDLPLLRVDELGQSLLLLPLGFDLRAPLGS